MGTELVGDVPPDGFVEGGIVQQELDCGPGFGSVKIQQQVGQGELDEGRGLLWQQ